MRVVFKPDARRDIKRHVNYSRHAATPEVAQRLRDSIQSSAELLIHAPLSGRIVEDTSAELGTVRKCGVQGFREYLLFYRSLPDRIQILRVIHAKRDYYRQLQ